MRESLVDGSVMIKDPLKKLSHANTVVKARSGSVLARGMILKADHFESGVSARLNVHLQGG